MTKVRFDPDRESHVAVITLDRPEARNAINGEMAAAIEAALDTVESDDALWVTIITGTSDLFCAGGDLKEIAAGSSALRTKRGGFAGIVRRDRDTPLIAAVEGYALAGGTEIVLACDLVVAGTSASFGIPEVKRGLVAGAGGLFRLGRTIPPRVAMEWALTGDAFPATRAFEVGLVNALVPDGTALDAARTLAGRVAANAPLAVQLSRRVMLDSTYLPESEAWQRNTAAIRSIGATNDFREGLTAFAEKRPPNWTAT